MASKNPKTPASKPLIVVDIGDVDTIPVRLGGVEYDVIPPKTAHLIARVRSADEEDRWANVDLMDAWVGDAFGDRADEIRGRLADPADGLDLVHIGQLYEAVTEAASGGRPTG